MAKADRRGPDRNTIIALSCFAFFGAMIGVAYAAVPLYQIFCQVTGYGGTTQRVEQYADRVLDKTIRVRFDANVSGGLPWEFTPDQRVLYEVGRFRFHQSDTSLDAFLTQLVALAEADRGEAGRFGGLMPAGDDPWG